MLVVTKNRAQLACHTLYLSAHPTPQLESTVGLVPGHRILVYDQKEVDLDALIFQEGRIQRMHLLILPPCL